MKKLTTLALVAMFAIAGAAFAGERFAGIEANATFANGLGATTTNNDDSCDIGVTPAATLLLPYFEVDVANTAGTGQTTLFTITNTSRLPQIAHVTLWTDWSFPVLDFNIFLTGYDVQAINLYDIIVRGVVAPTAGTSATNRTISPLGAYSAPVNSNPNILPAAVAAGGSCSSLPGALPTGLVDAVRAALTTGIYNVTPGGCGTSTRVGGTHANAIGYVTIDVANTCSTRLPDDPLYMTTELLFDNVLVGDFQQVNQSTTTGNYAQGNPMVHIRAIPEGGAAGSVPGTNLPYTFYDRYTNGIVGFPRTVDRRQPLPSTFAARWIQGGSTGFSTDYKIWREGYSLGAQACNEGASNSAITVADIIRFDEAENPFGFASGTICSPCGPSGIPSTPEALRVSTGTSQFPSVTNAATAGWMYLNLNNGGSAGYSAARAGFAGPGVTRASQNWVVVSMFAEGRYSTDFDAAWLGNGCTPAIGATITPGPAANVTP